MLKIFMEAQRKCVVLTASKTKGALAANVIKLVAMLMGPHRTERVHPARGALVLKKGHGKKADQRICKKDYSKVKIYATL